MRQSGQYFILVLVALLDSVELLIQSKNIHDGQLQWSVKEAYQTKISAPKVLCRLDSKHYNVFEPFMECPLQSSFASVITSYARVFAVGTSCFLQDYAFVLLLRNLKMGWERRSTSQLDGDAAGEFIRSPN